MDRFIAIPPLSFTVEYNYLKSNMDRFIVDKLKDAAKSKLFKIQYG